MLSITKVLNALLLIQIQVVYSWVLPNAILRCRLLNNPTTNNCRLYSSGKESEEDTWEYDDLEVLQGDGDDFYGDDDEEDWIPDGDLARRKPKKTHLTPANEVILSREDDVKETGAKTEKDDVKNTASPYTEEEEELIDAMGGKDKSTSQGRGQREIGFLGDSSLYEIATDYSVPICYMADVLCMWGVPVPINVHDRLGDLATGEQAFALVEAVNSLDVGVLQDRYSNQNLLQICDEWDIDLKDAFELAMKEGWSLPFGVRTNLRVEQEDELLRVFSKFYRE
jgi:hypothetical protein